MSIIIGQERQREYLNKVLMRERLAHAYVFAGPEQVGKLTIAKKLAQSFFCENLSSLSRKFEDACGICKACLKIEENQSTNVILLDTEHSLTSKKEVRRDIPIEDIRELKRLFALHALNEGKRVVIINEAEKLSEQATNAFLKLLEEPSRGALFILITVNPELLLPTILSRAQVIRFGLCADLQMISFAKKIGVSNIEEVVQLAHGRPGIFLQLLHDKNMLELRKKKTKFVNRLLHASLPDMFRTADKVSQDGAALKELLFFLFMALQEVLYTKKEQQEVIHFINAIKKIDRIHFLLETTNVNSRLALEVLFLEARKAYNNN